MTLKDKFLRDKNGHIQPYGGQLKNLQVKEESHKESLIKLASHEHKCS